MSKRKYDDVLTEETVWSQAVKSGPFKNSLDSEEEDDEVVHETYNVMKEDEFKGNLKILNKCIMFFFYN